MNPNPRRPSGLNDIIVILNTGLGRLFLLIAGFCLIGLLVGVLFPGNPSFIRIDGFLVVLLFVGLLTILAIVALCGVVLLRLARRVERGEPSGRTSGLNIAQNLAIVAAIVLLPASWGLGYAGEVNAGISKVCIQWLFVGVPLALYSSVHLLILRPTRRSFLIVGTLLLLPIMVFGLTGLRHTGIVNAGRIYRPLTSSYHSLTDTGHIICIGAEISAPRTLALLIWDYRTGKQILAKRVPQLMLVGNAESVLVCQPIDDARRLPLDHFLIYELPSGKQIGKITIRNVNPMSIESVQLSPTADRFAICYDDGFVDVHAVPAGNVVQSFQVWKSKRPGDGAIIRDLAFDKQGKMLAILSPGHVSLWLLSDPAAPVWQIKIREGSDTMSTNADDSRLHLFGEHAGLTSVDLKTGATLASFPMAIRNGYLRARDFSSDGGWVGIITHDGRVTLCETSTGKTREFSIGTQVTGAAMNLSLMRMVAMPEDSNWLQRWDLARGVETRTADR